ncbi:hypothetical protein JI739_03905 [Ramlibacter sp. AW1]|uniref:Uncharacterized protein n=1 Tax=Ramlibacter aurantiacus TaxID=2801330 RepID=A0A936ZNH6_9BURK|nr:hypothetical protein [Ramlibacter aurantiacus]MBL0419486.1 hypothetical protein [Ramlibacter aurantiacus]
MGGCQPGGQVLQAFAQAAAGQVRQQHGIGERLQPLGELNVIGRAQRSQRIEGGRVGVEEPDHGSITQVDVRRQAIPGIDPVQRQRLRDAPGDPDGVKFIGEVGAPTLVEGPQYASPVLLRHRVQGPEQQGGD